MERIFHTTWNAVARAVQHLDGNFDGLTPAEDDFDVALYPLDDHPGHLEVARTDGDTIYGVPAGDATSLSDWIYPYPADVRDREGIAVLKDILHFL